MRINPAILFALALPVSTLACTDDPNDQGSDPDVETIASCGLDTTLNVPSGAPASVSFTKAGNTSCGTKANVNMTSAEFGNINGIEVCTLNRISGTIAAGAWGLNTDGFDDDATECANSTLNIDVTYPSGAHVTQTVHPQWTGTECGAANVSITVDPLAASYGVSLTAIRGLPQNMHGYGKTTLSAGRSSAKVACNL